MRKFTKYIISFVAATYFLLAGTGYNIVNYCCSTCEVKGIEFIAEHDCNVAHEHETDCESDCCEEVKDISCKNVQHIQNGCHLYRATTEIPVFNKFDLQLDAPEFTDVFLLNDFSGIFNFVPDEKNAGFYPTDSSPPLHSGRDILCNKSVLLI